MATGKPTNTKTVPATIFTKDNYRWMAIGAAIMVLGLILLAGGKSQDPNQFNPDSVYSARRITVAPVLIVAGLLVELYAIVKKQKK